MMEFIIAILPVFLIGLFIYNKDKSKESSKLLCKLFFGGVGSCFPAAFIGGVLGVFFPEMENMNFFQLFFYVFIIIALVEEFCKWFVLYRISYNNHEFDTLYDMILYASFVALGFACFENILYVMESGISVGIMRAITAVPGHVCDGILMGSYLALAKYHGVQGNIEFEKKFKTMSILVPMVTHGIYDFCLFVGYPIFILIFVGFVITLFVICIKKVNNMSKNDVKFVYKNNFCTECGRVIKTDYCTNCGTKRN